MAKNRKGYDDAGVAQILKDLRAYGRMVPPTNRRLSHWCDTNGTVFKRGIAIAQQISMALEDRVIPREA